MVKRVRVAALAVIASSVCFLPGGEARVAMAGEGRPPNVLIIVTDDQRVDSMRVMPATRRWFREQGVEFTNAFVTTPLCCPSRASIFTGRFAHNHGVRRNKDASEIAQVATLQRYLQNEGFLTGIGGKFLNSWDIRQNPPSFDRWAILHGGYFRRTFNIDGNAQHVPGYTTDFIGEWGQEFVEWTEAEDETPWLLFLTPVAPHAPFTAAPRHAAAPLPRWRPSPAVGESDRSDKPEFVQERKGSLRHSSRVRAEQLRSLMAVDDLVARMAQTLGALGEEETTLAFFLSDNGFFWYEHGLHDKRMPYTEAVQIPFLVRWPGHVDPGSQVDGFVTNVDIVPTVLRAAGITRPPEILDGYPLFTGRRRERVFLEYFAGVGGRVPTWASIRTELFQFVEYYDEFGEVTFQEYFDLSRDPWQLRNLLGDSKGGPSAAKLQQLVDRLRRDRLCVGTATILRCP